MKDAFEAPYPLKQRFQRIVLPGLLLLTVIIAITVGEGSTWLTQKIYLQISENRSAIIDRAVSVENAKAWTALQGTTTPGKVYQTPEGQQLLQTLRGEVQELGLAHLKIYGPKGLILYSSKESEIGTSDPSTGYEKAFNGTGSLIKKQADDGTKLYELYTRVPDNKFFTVMELYEPVDYLDGLVAEVVIPAIAFPVVVLLVLAWGMNKLVGNAQSDINYRTRLLSEFRMRLQQLVSNEAVSSLRQSTGKSGIQSKRVKATILFSDVRKFTEFCETETPENVVSFLNRSLGIVIDAVRDHGGDVDKMIGDAVLAHFQGDDAPQRALAAAEKALTEMSKANLPRGIGIGIYTGVVVMGTVGASNRKDFTVIGDTVNSASRLCSTAKEGEIIIDEESCARIPDMADYTRLEISLKGKEKPEQVRILHHAG